MAGLRDALRIGHAMLLLVDREREVFYTMASLGYATSGVGAELPLAHGLAGVAVREGVVLRVGHMTTMTHYGRAARERTEELGLHGVLDDEIPLPGLARPRSQLAVALRAAGQTLGALLFESEQDQFFSYDDEDALTMVACQLGFAMLLLRGRAQASAGAPAAAGQNGAGSAPQGPVLRVRHHVRDHCVWFDDNYVIKGVAGAILWKLLDDWRRSQRTQFSNCELRQTSGLGLPEVQDNLEVRLLLLQRRLDEQAGPVRIIKESRGRWRLDVHRPVVLQSVES